MLTWVLIYLVIGGLLYIIGDWQFQRHHKRPLSFAAALALIFFWPLCIVAAMNSTGDGNG
jgi:hypothetical protein